MKKIIAKAIHIPLVLFPFEVLVCLGGDKQFVIKNIKKFGYTPDTEEEGHITMIGQGKCVMLKNSATIIWLKNYPRAGSGVLAHEIFHATDFILDKMGIKHTDSSDEVWAYVIEYLTKEIHKNL